QVLAIESRLGVDLGPVEHRPTAPIQAEVTAIRFVRHECTDGLGMLFLGQARKPGQLLPQSGQDLLALRAVARFLLGVADEDVALARLARTDDDLLDLQARPYL